MFKKICKICGCDFISTGPAALYCELHKEDLKAAAKQKNRISTANHRARTGKIKRPGVGKGGNPKYAEDNVHYKHGFYVSDRLRKAKKIEQRYCERCSTDLKDATHYKWVVHHKDHNHYNHSLDNLELLCRRCHQIEHECHKAFTKGATTIP